ncbi:unnamed protein product [Amoebophrya sp. A120]|nr:unnamed protein product [Amoebophrya sp. A120]|eukprot:GSA120T00009569001.1
MARPWRPHGAAGRVWPAPLAVWRSGRECWPARSLGRPRPKLGGVRRFSLSPAVWRPAAPSGGNARTRPAFCWEAAPACFVWGARGQRPEGIRAPRALLLVKQVAGLPVSGCWLALLAVEALRGRAWFHAWGTFRSPWSVPPPGPVGWLLVPSIYLWQGQEV